MQLVWLLLLFPLLCAINEHYLTWSKAEFAETVDAWVAQSAACLGSTEGIYGRLRVCGCVGALANYLAGCVYYMIYHPQREHTQT